MSNDQLDGRVARFSELAGNDALFVDTVIPGHARSIWAIIGPNVGEDRDTKVAIPPEGFHLAIVHCDPGNGAALHTHTTVEVFMPLSGRWQLTYGEEGEHDVTLEQWDVCSVPAGVWRAFENVAGADAHLLVLVGGTDAGRLTWAPGVLEEAGRRGMKLDAAGFIES